MEPPVYFESIKMIKEYLPKFTDAVVNLERNWQMCLICACYFFKWKSKYCSTKFVMIYCKEKKMKAPQSQKIINGESYSENGANYYLIKY